MSNIFFSNTDVPKFIDSSGREILGIGTENPNKDTLLKAGGLKDIVVELRLKPLGMPNCFTMSTKENTLLINSLINRKKNLTVFLKALIILFLNLETKFLKASFNSGISVSLRNLEVLVSIPKMFL